MRKEGEHTVNRCQSTVVSEWTRDGFRFSCSLRRSCEQPRRCRCRCCTYRAFRSCKFHINTRACAYLHVTISPSLSLPPLTVGTCATGSSRTQRDSSRLLLLTWIRGCNFWNRNSCYLTFRVSAMRSSSRILCGALHPCNVSP